MKKVIFVLFLLLVFITGCSKKTDYILNEDNFFLVMTNIQYYPENYYDSNLEFDCFTYEITDIDGNTYMCGVRKCSSGYGCKCGKDTVIGFLLIGDDIPTPINQYENTNEKTWVHLKGQIKKDSRRNIKIYGVNSIGELDNSIIEEIYFYEFEISELSSISDYSNLNYYVVK